MDVKTWLALSVKERASDLHLSPNMPPILRIHGELIEVAGAASLSAETTKAHIYGLLDAAQQKRIEETWELDFSVCIPGVGHFRVNAFRQAHGLAAVFRVIPDHVPTLESLALPTVFEELLSLPNGLILVTGPTGSGKSTSLAAMIDYINVHQNSHIITIEDPIEFTHQSKKSLINQRQVHRDTRDFSAALRSALRADPDVLMLGEMRDLETIRLALTAAETGHLVLASLHTSSAPRAINRIIDVFPAAEKNMIRNMLSESLQAVISQTLVKSRLGGRVAALEIMLGTAAIRHLIREDKIAQMQTVMQTGSEMGMCTLDQYLQALVQKGTISEQVARLAAIQRMI